MEIFDGEVVGGLIGSSSHSTVNRIVNNTFGNSTIVTLEQNSVPQHPLNQDSISNGNPNPNHHNQIANNIVSVKRRPLRS